MHSASWDPHSLRVNSGRGTIRINRENKNSVNNEGTAAALPIHSDNSSGSSSHLHSSSRRPRPPLVAASAVALSSSPPITTTKTLHSSSTESLLVSNHTDVLSWNTAPRPPAPHPPIRPPPSNQGSSSIIPSSSSFTMDRTVPLSDATVDDATIIMHQEDAARESIGNSNMERIQQQQGDGTAATGTREASTLSQQHLQRQQQESNSGTMTNDQTIDRDQDHQQGTEGDTVKKKRKRRPPAVPWKKPKDMPRRPLSAYNLFFKERREAMMKAAKGAESQSQQRAPPFGRRKSNKSVGIGFANLARTIASEWKTLDQGTKTPFEARATAEKERYDKEMLVWRAKQKQEKASAAAESKPERLPSSSAASIRQGKEDISMASTGSDGADIQFSSSGPGMSSMQASPLSYGAQNHFQGPPMTRDEMIMMGQYPSQQQRQQMMGWAELHSPMSATPNAAGSSEYSHNSAMQMSELSSAAVHTISRSQPQSMGFFNDHIDPSLAHRQRQLMWEQSQGFASSDSSMQQLPGSMARNVNSPSIPPSSGNFDEYAQQQQQMMMSSSMSHGLDAQRRGQMMDQGGGFGERRNTWSGMSQIQQGAFHQMQMEQLRQEEEILQEQLREHRRRYLEHEQQLQEERQRRASLQIQAGEDSNAAPRNLEPMAAHHISQHLDSWTEVRPTVSSSIFRLDTAPEALPQTPTQQSQQRSSDLFPSTWFEADPSVEGPRNSVDNSPIRYNPGADGDLNQKLSMKTTTGPPSPFGGQHGQHSVKKGKKTEADPWNPIELKESQQRFDNDEPRWYPPHQQQPSEEGKVGGGGRMSGLPLASLQQSNVGPASAQPSGMRVDDETATFLSHLRFGGGLDTPDRSPASGER